MLKANIWFNEKRSRKNGSLKFIRGFLNFYSDGPNAMHQNNASIKIEKCYFLQTIFDFLLTFFLHKTSTKKV